MYSRMPLRRQRRVDHAPSGSTGTEERPATRLDGESESGEEPGSTIADHAWLYVAVAWVLLVFCLYASQFLFR
jgi:hypothetical protein